METPEEASQPIDKVTKELIGQTVLDAYGWTVGRIIGVSTVSQDSVSLLGIELSNGGFMKCEVSSVRHVQNAVTIDRSWRMKAEDLTGEIAMVARRISALRELKKEVSEKAYEDLQNGYENEKNVLLERRRSLSEQLKGRLESVSSQFNDIHEFVAHMKISHHLGDIDEKTYQFSKECFQLMIDRLRSEEDDIKFALDGLSANLSILPPEPLKSLPPSKPDESPDTPIRLRITDT